MERRLRDGSEQRHHWLEHVEKRRKSERKRQARCGSRAEEPARGISQYGGDDPSVSDRAQSMGAKRKTRSARISTTHGPGRIQRLQAGARDPVSPKYIL